MIYHFKKRRDEEKEKGRRGEIKEVERERAAWEGKECKEDMSAIREGIPQGGREGH